jgi:hypothetical protein
LHAQLDGMESRLGPELERIPTTPCDPRSEVKSTENPQLCDIIAVINNRIEKAVGRISSMRYRLHF